MKAVSICGYTGDRATAPGNKAALFGIAVTRLEPGINIHPKEDHSSTPACGDAMSLIYSSSSRALQDTFDTRRLADRLAEVKVRDHFTVDDRQFIERLDMFFLATVDAMGQPTCSYKG